jgi:hypothetical protein
MIGLKICFLITRELRSYTYVYELPVIICSKDLLNSSLLALPLELLIVLTCTTYIWRCSQPLSCRQNPYFLFRIVGTQNFQPDCIS